MNLILKRAFSSAGWKFVYYCSTFILNLTIVQFLGAANSGSMYYLVNILSMIVLILGSGLENSISYFYSTKKMTEGQLQWTAICWSTATTLLFGLLNSIFHWLPSNGLNFPSFYIYAFIFGSLLFNLTATLLYAKHNSRNPNLIPAFLNIILVFVLLGIYFFTEKKMVYRVVGYFFLLPLLSGLTIWVLQLVKHPVSLNIEGILPRKFLVHSFTVFVSALCVGILTRIDVWFVERYCSATELGNFIQAAKFIQLALMVPLMASFSLFPSFTQSLNVGLQVNHTVTQISNIYFYSVLFFCLLFALTGKWVLPFLFGHSFASMHLLVIVLAPGVVCYATAYPLISYFTASGRNLLIASAAAEGAIVLLILDLLFIPKFSVYGAAMGTACANIYYFIRLYLQFKKRYHTSLWQFVGFQALRANFSLLIKTYQPN